MYVLLRKKARHVECRRAVPMRCLVFLGIVSTALAACTSGSDPTPEMFVTSPPPQNALTTRPLSAEAQESCRASATSLCARLEGCSSLLPLMYGTRTACEAAVADECAARYEGPGASTTPAPCDASALSCEDMRTVLVLDLSLSESPGAALLQFCPTTKGQLAVGEHCLRGADCASGLCDAKVDGCGRCIEGGSEGASCNTHEGCATGLHCLHNGSTGHCVRFGHEGEACSSEDPCAGLACVEGVCRAYAQAGERCDEEGPLCDEANALACDGDLTCRPFIIDEELSDACKVHIFSPPNVGARVCPWSVERIKQRGACKRTEGCRRSCAP